MGGFGQLGNQEEPQYRYRKGLLSQGSNSIAMKSRVNREVQARLTGDNRKARPCCLKQKCYRRISRVSAQNLKSIAMKIFRSSGPFCRILVLVGEAEPGRWWRPTRQGIANWRLIQTMSGGV